jgi:hypothetical protein
MVDPSILVDFADPSRDQAPPTFAEEFVKVINGIGAKPRKQWHGRSTWSLREVTTSTSLNNKLWKLIEDFDRNNRRVAHPNPYFSSEVSTAAKGLLDVARKCAADAVAVADTLRVFLFTLRFLHKFAQYAALLEVSSPLPTVSQLFEFTCKLADSMIREEGGTITTPGLSQGAPVVLSFHAANN